MKTIVLALLIITNSVFAATVEENLSCLIKNTATKKTQNINLKLSSNKEIIKSLNIENENNKVIAKLSLGILLRSSESNFSSYAFSSTLSLVNEERNANSTVIFDRNISKQEVYRGFLTLSDDESTWVDLFIPCNRN